MTYSNKEWSLLNSFTECLISTPAELDIIIKVVYEEWEMTNNLEKGINLLKTELETNYAKGINFKDKDAYELGTKLLANEDKITHQTGYSLLSAEQSKLIKKKRINSNLTEDEREVLRKISNLY